MASGGTPSTNPVYLFRLQTLIVDGGTLVLRKMFDQRLPNVTLNVFLSHEKTSINRLRRQKTITTQQFDLLYPQSGQLPNSSDFDITLIICLLRNLKSLGLNRQYNWNATPQPADTSVEADLCRLKGFRKEVAHISSTFGIQPVLFQTKWTEIEQVLLRLNSAVPNPDPTLKQTIDSYMYKNDPLDPVAEQRIQKEIGKWRTFELGLETEMLMIEKDVKQLNKSVDDVNVEVKVVEKDVLEVSEGVQKVDKGVTKVSKAVKKVEKNVSKVNEVVQEVGKDVIKVSVDVHNIDTGVTNVSEKVKRVKRDVLKKREDVQKVDKGVTKMSEEVKDVAKDVSKVSESITEVREMRQDVKELKLHDHVLNDWFSKLETHTKEDAVSDSRRKKKPGILKRFKNCFSSGKSRRLKESLSAQTKTPTLEEDEAYLKMNTVAGDTRYDESDIQKTKIAIDKAWRNVIDYMEPDPILDCAIEIDLFGYRETRDIKEVKNTTEKNMRILEKVRSKGNTGYEKFKDCLHKTDQSILVKLLESIEREEDTSSLLQQIKEKKTQETMKDKIGPWTECIAQKDENAADELTEHGILPNNEELIHVCNEFGRTSKTFSKVCNKISEYVRKKSDKIIDAWASYRVNDLVEDGRITSIVFVVLTNDSSDDSIYEEISDYNTYLRCVTDFSKESEVVLAYQLSDVTSNVQNEQEVLQNKQKSLELRQIILKHADKLMDDHSNISVISPSFKRSIGYRTEHHHILDEPCIAIYVHVKGFIPTQEDPLPKEISGYYVDVLEGEFGLFTGRPNDFHDKLKMGLAIHAKIKNTSGTLGGFLEHPVHGLCGITCAHVVSSPDEFVKKTSFCPENRQVFQPTGEDSKPFGNVVRILHHVGDEASPGMEVALFQIHERHPENGSFPFSFYYDNAGFNDDNPFTFNSGEVLEASEIENATVAFKFGKETAITRGIFEVQGTCVREREMSTEENGFGIRLKNQISVLCCVGKPFAVKGDSGALVLVKGRDGGFVAIGIVEGGMGGRVYVTPICDILRALGCTMKQFNRRFDVKMEVDSP